MDPDAYLCQLADIFNGITVNPPSFSAIVAIVLAGVLLLASGFASASEIAFFSLSPSDLNEIDERNHPSDEKISSLLGDSESLLATVLITNNFVNVTIIMLCNFFFMNVFVFHSALAEFLILTVILTFLLLLFGEIMPKIYSAQKTLVFCRFAAPGIYVLRKVFRPVSALLVRSTTFLNKRFTRKNHNISVDELSQALELTDKAELTEENNILEGIIRFGGETAKEVMTSRLDVVDLDIRTSFKDVMKSIAGEKKYDLLFIGNSRRVYRQIVQDALTLDYPLTIYGRHWEAFEEAQKCVREPYMPNDQVGQAYRDAKIVLNDHWDDMKETGIVSNRLFDALAAEAFIISDEMPEIEEIFEGTVVTYKDCKDLKEKVDYYMEHPKEAEKLAERGHQLVLEKHTFAKRMDKLVQDLSGL